MDKIPVDIFLQNNPVFTLLKTFHFSTVPCGKKQIVAVGLSPLFHIFLYYYCFCYKMIYFYIFIFII